MRDNPGGQLDPADDVRRRCKKNSHSVLSGTGKRTRKGGDLNTYAMCEVCRRVR